MAKTSARSPRAASTARTDDLETHMDELSDASEADEVTPPPLGKRKREAADGAATPNDEDEIARRRRRRKSLAFQQRRKSLTLTSKAKTGGAAPATKSRQYISDMYSTIIKMSSENKINVKNSWSLHLIDHMEDILETPRDKDGEGDENPDGTYNFQKASCTLDASIKIYSYRVDDTWNSSYKILENLSRTENKHGAEDATDDAGEPTRKTRKVGAAARTIEKNLNNINLKTYETEFEADPLFHKMSQSFDEGGAKGMLLANLSVYDGCKILLNSAEVKMSTRKSASASAAVAAPPAPNKADDDDVVIKEEVLEAKPLSARISLSCFGSLSCFSQDTQSMEVCPPLRRLYDQIEEYYGDETRLKLGVKNEFLLKTPVKGRRQVTEQADKIAMNLAGIMEDAAEENSDGEGEDDNRVDFFDANDDGDDDEVGDAVASVEGDDSRTETEDDNSVDMDTDAGPAEASQSATPEEDAPESGETAEEETEPVDEEPAKPTSASDFFRSRAEASRGQEAEANELSEMIESAMVRSASLAEEVGEDLDGVNDYSYFDVKMLRNWAGPVHWKFPAMRKFQTKTRVEKLKKDSASVDAGDVDGGENTGDVKSDQADAAKKPSGVDKKTVLIDFFADVPDFDALFKPPSSPSSLVMSKAIVSRQMQRASELVLPVDTHIEIGLFFQRFLKPKLKFFKRPTTAEHSGRNEFDAAGARGEMDTDDGDRSFGGGFDGDVGGFDGGYDDDNDSAVDASHADEVTYSTDGLVAAQRVVEKIDVHYERVAKRVDVKKLKTSIWDHLGTVDAPAAAVKTAKPAVEEPVVVKNESGKRPREDEDKVDEKKKEKEEVVELDTSFESVVESVAATVPPNVSVSFYFICMLHLANEKGLKLTGQQDLRNFHIQKD